jgi:hypothetical protein
MHTKTLQQKHEFNNSRGMKAYRKHHETGNDYKEIWEKKDELINKIIRITKEDKKVYSFCSPEDLEKFLNKAEHAYK